MLRQAEEMGTSLGETLTVFSQDMRSKRMLRAEEKALALSAKLTVPLILFIFPLPAGRPDAPGHRAGDDGLQALGRIDIQRGARCDGPPPLGEVARRALASRDGGGSRLQNSPSDALRSAQTATSP